MSQKTNLFVVALLLSLGCLPPTAVSANSTAVSQTINPGLLTLTTRPTASLSALNVDAAHDQTSHGSLGNIEATDSRGSGAGWSVTATASNFGAISPAVQTSGSGGQITASGSYTGRTSGTYTLTITTAGNQDSAQFSVTGLENQSGLAASGSDAPVGTHGLTVRFAAGNYQVGDSWNIRVDSISAGRLTISPSAINAMVGAYQGVVAGSSHQFNDDTDGATIMTAASGSGMGWYINTPALSLTVPPETRAGNYVATITETIN